MNLPLGVAITEYLAETGMPTIAHHHDFYWERTRFSVNAVQDYLDFAFPPRVPNLLHVTINQAAQEDLGFRKGLSSELVPNVLDFETPPPQIDNYSADIRNEIGLTADDIMVLQPTRVVPRKGIEHAIKLIEMLGDPRCKLVITHESGDEGMEYHHMIAELAREANVDLQFVDSRIGEIRSRDSEGRKIYTLWDFYLHADLVTFPSLYEGFGNAFLETLYFKKPILMNRYAIFARDIEPKGFQLPLIDGFVTKTVVDEVRRILENDAYRQAMVDHNFVLATKFYSYRVLKSKLETLISDLKGL
jgi:glycosyltransferase involved in cell wall biosynthesis